MARVKWQMNGKLSSPGEGGTDGKCLSVCTCMCGSADDCGCVVNGSSAMAASRVLLLLFPWPHYKRRDYTDSDNGQVVFKT